MNKNFNEFKKETEKLTKYIIFGAIIIALIMLINIPFTSAWSNTTLYNGSSYLNTENLTFSGNQNITRYLIIPQNTYLTNAFMNLSGFNYTNYSNLVREYYILPNILNDWNGIIVNSSEIMVLDDNNNLGDKIWFFNNSFNNYKNITLSNVNDTYRDFFINNTAIITLNTTAITRRNMSGTNLSHFNLNSSNNAPRGFYYNNSNYYVTDVGDDGIYVYNNSGFNTIFYDFAGATGFRNIKGNGTSIYIVDSFGGNKIREFNYSFTEIKNVSISNYFGG